MIKALVLATDYSDDKGKVVLHYIHTRNVEYVKEDIDVTVLNFSTSYDYIIDGIRVISLETYINSHENYDVLISHAPNVRQHYKFLKKYGDSFESKYLFFHGHEVLRMSEAYPKPYSYMKDSSFIRKTMRNVYDSFKFSVWRKYILNNPDTNLIFVSNWMYDEFKKYLKLNDDRLKNVYIIHNSVGAVFEENEYNPVDVEFDFITIRSQIDFSKYCIDVVWEIAKRLPDKKFLVVGKGEFFNHHEKLDNIVHLDTHLNHSEVVHYLNKSRYALLPTRTDAQGVMGCEMIAFGIPLITSDIKVMREIFADTDNVLLVENTTEGYNTFENKLSSFNFVDHYKLDKFNKVNTVDKEIELIKSKVKR